MASKPAAVVTDLGGVRCIAAETVVTTSSGLSPALRPASRVKAAIRWAAIAALGIDPVRSLAVGDGANDLAMIRAAGLGVAYHAKPIVAAAAAARIDHGDLSALLYAQGIPRADWAI